MNGEMRPGCMFIQDEKPLGGVYNFRFIGKCRMRGAHCGRPQLDDSGSRYTDDMQGHTPSRLIWARSCAYDPDNPFISCKTMI